MESKISEFSVLWRPNLRNFEQKRYILTLLPIRTSSRHYKPGERQDFRWWHQRLPWVSGRLCARPPLRWPSPAPLGPPQPRLPSLAGAARADERLFCGARGGWGTWGGNGRIAVLAPLDVSTQLRVLTYYREALIFTLFFHRVCWLG